jgi:hypothetical protein
MLEDMDQVISYWYSDACSSVSEFDIFSLKAAICINRYILLVSPTKIGEFVD